MDNIISEVKQNKPLSVRENGSFHSNNETVSRLNAFKENLSDSSDGSCTWTGWSD